MNMLSKIIHHCTEEGDCLLWRRSRCNGHPAMRIEGKTQLIRRVIWQESNGEIPQGKIVRVTCGSPLCINPSHIELTSYQKLGKQLGALGIMSGQVRSAAIQRAKRKTQGKLSLDAVRDIRTSDETTIVLAARYGVAQAHISKVRKHKCQRDYSSPFAGLGARL